MTADAGASTTTETASSEAADAADVVSDPKYWKMMAEKHLSTLRTAFLAKDPQDRHRLLTERIAALEPSLADEKRTEGKTAFTSVRDAFRGEKDIARLRQTPHRRPKPKLPEPPCSDKC